MSHQKTHTPRPTSGGAADRIILRGGIVVTMDPSLGEFLQADVLIEGNNIVDVAPRIEADAQIVDCTGRIVMPGFVNTHHHQFYAAQRAISTDASLWGPWPQETYFSIQDIMTFGRILDPNFQPVWDLGRSPYDPEDVFIAELISSYNQINQGVTTGIDTSQCQHNPDYSEAMIEALRESGRRTMFVYSYGRGDDPRYEFPGTSGDPNRGLARLQSQHFSSSDQLLTLGLNTDHFLFTGFNPADVAYARELGVPLIQHNGPSAEAIEAGLLGPDMEFIHVGNLPLDTWKAMSDGGVHISLSPAIEMQMGHGTPPVQTALEHGILPSLSSDVETNMAADMFTQMRAAYTVQRMGIYERIHGGDYNAPPLLTAQQTLEMATVAGAACAHLEDKIGTLTPGKRADVIVLDTQTLNLAGFHNVPGAIVTLMDTSNVRHVLIDGTIKKWDGELVDVDITSLVERVNASRERIFERVASKPIPVDGLHTAPGFSPSRFDSCSVGQTYATRPPINTPTGG